MVIFHSYVSLPEGTQFFAQDFHKLQLLGRSEAAPGSNSSAFGAPAPRPDGPWGGGETHGRWKMLRLWKFRWVRGIANVFRKHPYTLFIYIYTYVLLYDVKWRASVNSSRISGTPLCRRRLNGSIQGQGCSLRNGGRFFKWSVAPHSNAKALESLESCVFCHWNLSNPQIFITRISQIPNFEPEKSLKSRFWVPRIS